MHAWRCHHDHVDVPCVVYSEYSTAFIPKNRRDASLSPEIKIRLDSMTATAPIHVIVICEFNDITHCLAMIGNVVSRPVIGVGLV